jgi:negative regulator of flagellin synthesis FlgM
MKIENDKKTALLDNLVKSNQLKSSKDSKRIDGQASGNITDKVELSGRKEEIQRIKDMVKAAPAVREDKVDQVRTAIQTGTYNVKGKLVAQSMLKSQLLDEIL